MAKRQSVKAKASRSRKTKKRIVAKNKMLAAKKKKR